MVKIHCILCPPMLLTNWGSLHALHQGVSPGNNLQTKILYTASLQRMYNPFRITLLFHNTILGMGMNYVVLQSIYTLNRIIPVTITKLAGSKLTLTPLLLRESKKSLRTAAVPTGLYSEICSPVHHRILPLAGILQDLVPGMIGIFRNYADVCSYDLGIQIFGQIHYHLRSIDPFGVVLAMANPCPPRSPQRAETTRPWDLMRSRISFLLAGERFSGAISPEVA